MSMTETSEFDEQNLTDIREHVINYTINDVTQLQRSENITVQMTVEYTNLQGQRVMFIGEKCIELSQIVDEHDAGVVIKGFLSSMKDHIILKPNYNAGLQVVEDYKRYQFEVEQDTVAVIQSLLIHFEKILKDLKSGVREVDDDLKAYIDKMTTHSDGILTVA